jgi:hypothetical protein
MSVEHLAGTLSYTSCTNHVGCELLGLKLSKQVPFSEQKVILKKRKKNAAKIRKAIF